MDTASLMGSRPLSLEPFAGDPRVHETLAAWAEKYGAFDFATFEFMHAQILAELLGTPASGNTAPLLPDLLDRPIPAHTRCRIAAELASHRTQHGFGLLHGETFDSPHQLEFGW